MLGVIVRTGIFCVMRSALLMTRSVCRSFVGFWTVIGFPIFSMLLRRNVRRCSNTMHFYRIKTMETDPELARLCSRLRLGSAIGSLGFGESEQKTIVRALGAVETDRKIKAFGRALGAAHLNPSRILENYDFTGFQWPEHLPQPDFVTCGFISRAENIIMFGPSGTGKTRLANSIGVEAVRRGFRVLFVTVSDFVARLLMEHERGRHLDYLNKLKRLDLLILDEFGYVSIDKNAAELLFQVVSNFYERRSIIITSNQLFDEWGKMFPDPALSTALLDRIVQYCHLIRFTGESYRLTHSLMK